MDIIIEFILELVFGSVLESEKVKTGTKTALMVVISLVMEAFFIFACYWLGRNGAHPLLTIAVAVLAVWFGWVAIRGQSAATNGAGSRIGGIDMDDLSSCS